MGMDTLLGLSYTNVSMNLLTDFIFAVLFPVPMLWKLNINTRTRYSLIAIFAIGIFACLAAWVKTVYLLNYGVSTDALWETRNNTIWNVAELNIGIVAGTSPALRPLFIRLLGEPAQKPSEPMLGVNEEASRRAMYNGRTSGWANLSITRKGKEKTSDSESERGLNKEHEVVQDYEMQTYVVAIAAGESDLSRKTREQWRHDVDCKV